MFICYFYRFVELVPSENKLWYGDWGIRWVFNLSSKIYDRGGNLLWFFLLEVVSAYVQNDWIWQKLKLGLQSNQVKRTPQESINEFIIQKLNPLPVVDFRLISALLHV